MYSHFSNPTHTHRYLVHIYTNIFIQLCNVYHRLPSVSTQPESSDNVYLHAKYRGVPACCGPAAVRPCSESQHSLNVSPHLHTPASSQQPAALSGLSAVIYLDTNVTCKVSTLTLYLLHMSQCHPVTCHTNLGHVSRHIRMSEPTWHVTQH